MLAESVGYAGPEPRQADWWPPNSSATMDVVSDEPERDIPMTNMDP